MANHEAKQNATLGYAGAAPFGHRAKYGMASFGDSLFLYSFYNQHPNRVPIQSAQHTIRAFRVWAGMTQTGEF